MTIKPDAYEQLTLELINRARTDPGGEFTRLITSIEQRTGVTQNITDAINFFQVDLAVLANQFSSLVAASPLAWSDKLSQSATTHSQLMIDNDSQSHNLPGEPNLGDRVLAVGFIFQTLGENIFLFGEDALYSHAAFFIDWGNTSTGIQNPAGHRDNIMDAAKKEIGIGVIAESDASTAAGPNVITHHIGTEANTQPALLGVVINDTDNDNFYDIGEGVAGVTVTATGSSGTFTTTTWEAGGYQLNLADGSYNVTFTGQNINRVAQVIVAGNNVKLDAETGETTTADLFLANSDIAKGLSAAYQLLLGGVPSQAGFTSLINTAVSTNFGSGGTTVFNAENVFINLFNNLVQGNQAAGTQFSALAGTGTLSDQITALYNAIVPETSRSAEGLAFFNRTDATSFYTASALERGIMSENGPAVIAAAAILRIVVRDDIPGLGDNVNDLFMAVTGNSAALPAASSTFTDINVADGTAFDSDDVSTTIITSSAFATTSPNQEPSIYDLENGPIEIIGPNTTASTPVDSAPAIQEINSRQDKLVFNTITNDIVELDFDLAGTALGDGSAASVDGTNLLAALQGLSVESDGGSGYLVAYQNGNAFVYTVQESMDNDNILEASDIQLIGSLNGVSVGELDISNFDFV